MHSWGPTQYKKVGHYLYIQGDALLYQENKPAEALQKYSDAIQYNPLLYQAYVRRGVFYRDRGELAKAQSDFLAVWQMPNVKMAEKLFCGLQFNLLALRKAPLKPNIKMCDLTSLIENAKNFVQRDECPETNLIFILALAQVHTGDHNGAYETIRLFLKRCHFICISKHFQPDFFCLFKSLIFLVKFAKDLPILDRDQLRESVYAWVKSESSLTTKVNLGLYALCRDSFLRQLFDSAPVYTLGIFPAQPGIMCERLQEIASDLDAALKNHNQVLIYSIVLKTLKSQIYAQKDLLDCIDLKYPYLHDFIIKCVSEPPLNDESVSIQLNSNDEGNRFITDRVLNF